MNSKLFVIIHKACPDGAGAAWAAHKKHPDADFWYASHGGPAPDVTDRDVVIADFCYPRAQLLEMKSKAKSLQVLDHHATAQRDCGDLDFCHFDMTKSGAVLSWEYFHPGAEVPWLLQYIQYRDLGFLFTRKEHDLPDVEAILAAVDSYPRDFDTWTSFSYFSRENRNALALEGKAILRYKNQLVEQLLKNAHEIEIDGHKVKAVNAPIFQSEIGNLLTAENEFGVTYYQGKDTLKFSLRSIDGKLDVSKIGESFPGGGGHRNASGFNVPMVDIGEHLKCSNKK